MKKLQSEEALNDLLPLLIAGEVQQNPGYR
jgi:hypothetical protein